MKISLALGPREPLSRQSAWGCFTTNLALPGFGSLLAGRVSGYPQVALSLSGLGLSMLFGLRFIWWGIANWSRIQQPQIDPFAGMEEMWRRARLPLLGLAIFGLAWLWALITSLQIINDARRVEAQKQPPRL